MAFLYKTLALLALLAPWALTAQTYPAFTIPDSLRAGANEVVREESMEFVAQSDKEGVITYRKVVTLLNNNSEADQVVVFYDADTKVRRLEAHLYDAFGQEVRKVGKNEIKDYAAVDGFSIYQDDRYKLLEVHHSQYPYTVAFEYEMTVRGLYFVTFPNWAIQDYAQSVERARLSITLPTDIALYYQVLNINLEPQVQEAAGATTYNWSVRGLKAVEQEPFSPSDYEILPRVITAPGRFNIEGNEGSMSSWQAYGAFVNRLYQGRDQLPPTLAAEVRALTADATSNSEKIARLYRYLQRNMRYVSVQLGIGGWQPFDATYVAENKYGDCKALSNFMKALLREVGITAYPVLIKNGALPYEVQEDFTRPFFNHVILCVPDEDTWLECTSTNLPPGYIGAGNCGRNVLLVTEEGGKLAHTPALRAEDNRAISRTEIKVNADGSASARSVLQASGAEHEGYRSAAAWLSREDLEKWFMKESSLPSLHLESLQVNANPDKPEATLEWQGKMPRYASRAGKRLFLPLNLLNPFEGLPKKMDNRRFPVVVQSGFTHIDTIILDLPHDFQVESQPEGAIELNEAYATYQAKVVLEPGRATFIRRFQIRPFRLPAEQYEAFRSFLAQVSKADKTMLVLVEKKT